MFDTPQRWQRLQNNSERPKAEAEEFDETSLCPQCWTAPRLHVPVLGVPAAVIRNLTSTTTRHRDFTARQSALSTMYRRLRWNPINVIAPLIFVLISVPFAIFAVFTTTIAVLLLSGRVAVVVVQHIVALTGLWLLPPPEPSRTHRNSSTSTSPTPTSNHRRSRTSSVSSPEVITSLPRMHFRKNSVTFALPSDTSETMKDACGIEGQRAEGLENRRVAGMGTRSITPSSRSPKQSKSHSRMVGEGTDYFNTHRSSGHTSGSPFRLAKHHLIKKSGSSSSSIKLSDIAFIAKKEEG